MLPRHDLQFLPFLLHPICWEVSGAGIVVSCIHCTALSSTAELAVWTWISCVELCFQERPGLPLFPKLRHRLSFSSSSVGPK